MIRIKEVDFSNVINKKQLEITDEIEDVFITYMFEIPTIEVRKEMCKHISLILGNKDIIDKTTNEQEYEGKYSYFVKMGDIEYPLMTYVKHMKMIDRKAKLMKIKEQL